jgi:site-specific DNA-methyltransferase (adenine-specific)
MLKIISGLECFALQSSYGDTNSIDWAKADVVGTLRFEEASTGVGAFNGKWPTRPALTRPDGVLFRGDCLEMLPAIATDSVDTVFADPPFNLGKEYGDSVNDSMADQDYLDWCKRWIDECIRVLKPGGSFFLYNIPKWNIRLANLMSDQGMHFRDWIVVDIKLGLPIPGRLYPSHYSLLYFTKGKPKTFHNIRTPIKKCRHCDGDVKDYGGHRNAMNPKGVNLTDVWGDIPPVRHWKFKSKKRKANALSTKLLDRVIEMSTEAGDVVLDPFGGSGTTFAVCEKKGRRWIGMEIESVDVIVERLENDDLDHYRNEDFVER